MNRWRRVLRRACNPAGGFLNLRIFLFAAAVPLLMRIKLTRLQSLLEPKTACRVDGRAELESTVGYLAAIVALGPPLVRRSCLTRGVTLYYFLRRAGLDVALDFGVGTIDGEVVGHCWLVKDGEPYLEARDPRPLYVAVYRMGFGAPGRGSAGLPADAFGTNR